VGGGACSLKPAHFVEGRKGPREGGRVKRLGQGHGAGKILSCKNAVLHIVTRENMRVRFYCLRGRGCQDGAQGAYIENGQSVDLATGLRKGVASESREKRKGSKVPGDFVN